MGRSGSRRVARLLVAGIAVAASLLRPAAASPAAAADGRRAGADLGDDLHARPRQVARPRRDRADREEHEAGPRPPDAERHAHDPLLLRVGVDRRPARGDRGPPRRSASSTSRRRSRRTTASRGSTVAFPADLYFGQTETVSVAFDLPGGAPRSESEIRVGSAFATFSAWAFGDGGDVQVVVPGGFDVERDRLADAEIGRRRRQHGLGDRHRPTRPTGTRRSSRTARPRSRATGSTCPAASTSSSAPGPRTPSGRRASPSCSGPGCRSSSTRSGLDWPVDRRHRGHRGPHAAARGLRRHLPHRRAPDRDQRGPRRAHDPPRGVARLVQRRPVRRALDRRGARRRVRLAGPRRGLDRRAGPRPGHARPTPRRSGSTTGRSRAGSPTRRPGARETYGYDAAWTVVRALVADAGEAGMRRRARRRRAATRPPTSGRARPRRSRTRPTGAGSSTCSTSAAARPAPTRSSGAGS